MIYSTKYPVHKGCQNFLIINDFMEVAIDWILTNQQISDSLPRAALWMTSYGLSEEVFHSGGVHMTSQNKHHGSLYVVLDEWYKNG